MNKYDAAKVLGLSGELTPRETKKAYFEACKKYHPDINPAGAQMMKIINEAYDELRDFIGNIEQQQEQPLFSEELNDALNAVVNLPNVYVEICGAWLWVTGNTKEHKDIIKSAGFYWSKKKSAWYFKPAGFKSRYGGNTTLDEIRAKYGSQRAHTSNQQYLA